MWKLLPKTLSAHDLPVYSKVAKTQLKKMLKPHAFVPELESAYVLTRQVQPHYLSELRFH